jgi:uncharacterized damage-inducible protein DinB
MAAADGESGCMIGVCCNRRRTVNLAVTNSAELLKLGPAIAASARISRMLEMLRDLVLHNGHANAAMLSAVRQNEAAVADTELCQLLHHILVANRFWLLTVLGLPFVFEEESRPSCSFDVLAQRCARTHEQQSAWLGVATDADLARILESGLIPGGRCSVAQAFMQVCMHSHGHRAQCAKLLRRHGGVPPSTDFILWLAGRPTAEWADTIS